MTAQERTNEGPADDPSAGADPTTPSHPAPPAPASPRPWPRHGSRPGHEYRIFRTRWDDLTNPRNGERMERVVVETPDWVNVVAIDEDGRMVVIEQFRFGPAANTIEIPGGMVEPGEEPRVAAERELREETGYTSSRWIALGSVSPNPAFHDNRCHHFLALDARKTDDLEQDRGEDIVVRTMALDEVRRGIADGTIDHALVLTAVTRVMDLRLEGLALDGPTAAAPTKTRTAPAPAPAITGTARRTVAVVGGGIVGLSAAYFLSAELGPDTDLVLVEREPQHDVHSTGRSAEILRVAIPDPVTRSIAMDSAELLDDPAAAGLGGEASFLDRRGLVVVRDANETPDWLAQVRERGHEQELTRAEYETLCPHYAPVGTAFHRFVRGGGIDRPRLVRVLAREAQRNGARFLRSRGVSAIETADGGRRVSGLRFMDGTTLAADDIVLAAGAWTRDLGASIGAPLALRPTRRHLLRYGADALPHTRAADVPSAWDDVANTYLRPEASGTWLFSVCDQTDAGDVDDPERYRVDPSVVADARAKFARHTGADPEPLDVWVGFRDLSPDDRPILGPDGRVAGLHWCAGAGGHGFTLSLGVGWAFAECFVSEAAPYREPCKRDRFVT